MKKMFFILSVLLILSCAPSRNFYIYYEDYPSDQREVVIKDIYRSLKVLDIDSIPLDDWLIFQNINEKGHFIERHLIKEENNKKKTSYHLIFTSEYLNDTTIYNYSIKCHTKDEKIWEGKK